MSLTAQLIVKTCSRCKTEKPTESFAGNASNADGLQRHCKECMRAMRSNPSEKATVASLQAAANAPVGSVLDTLPLAVIIASATNPRRHFNAARLQELADSIKASGVHQPILVRPLPANRVEETSYEPLSPQAAWPLPALQRRSVRPTHEIIAGERRYRASQLAGMATIPVLITRMSDDKVLELQIVENLQRDDLHPMEEAEGYQRLCEATGITKDDVGAKIGKSRSYVYQRIKLLDLTQAARDAFVEDLIDMSRALIIARCPDTKLQLKALAECTRKDFRGDVSSVRSFQAWAQQNIMLRLDNARFDTSDVDLVADCGSCSDCAKRTGAAPDLFADVDSDDMCIDPQCFHQKRDAHDQATIEKAQRAGRKVIPIEKAEKIFEPYNSQRFKGYMELDRSPDSGLGIDGGNLRKALGKHCPPPVLVMDPKGGGLVELVPADQVRKAIKENGLSRGAKIDKKMAAKAAQLPIEDRKEFADRWQKDSLREADAHFKGWTGEIPASLLRAFLAHEFDLDEGPFGPALDLGTEFNTSDALNRLLGMPDSSMYEVFVRWMLHSTEYSYPGAWSVEQRNRSEPRHPTWEILKMAEVDVDEIQSAVRRAIEGEERLAAIDAEARKTAKGKRTRSAQADGSTSNSLKAQPQKKSNAPPAARVLRAKKPTAQEVQGQIAEALQALEPSTDQAAIAASPEEVAAVAAEGNDQAPDGARHEEEAADAAAAPAQSLVVESAPLLEGDSVTFKKGLKDDKGRTTKYSGKEGTVLSTWPDGSVQVRYGTRPHETVTVPLVDLEPPLQADAGEVQQ